MESNFRKTRVLVVDDNPAGLYATCKVLKNEGFITYEAETGNGALSSIREYQPDVVLLDVKLPDISGFEVCKIVKSDPKLSNTPVIHLSATYLDSDSKVMGLQGGADAYLTHPVEPKVLVATINAVLRIRQAEAKVHDAAIKWQTTFDAIKDGVCLLDTEERVTQCNKAFLKILNQTENEVTGKKITDLSDVFNNCCPEFFKKPLYEKMSEEKCEIFFNGFWYLSSVDVIKDEKGFFSGSVFKMTDITTEKKSEEQIKVINKGLTELNSTKDKLFSIISHDLRGPFSGFIGLAKGLINDTEKLTKEEISEYGSAIFITAKKLYGLLNNLLEWAKLQSGSLKTEPVQLNLYDEINDITNLFSSAISEKSLCIINEVQRDAIVYADKQMLSTVLGNLVSNAIKFSNTGGNIKIETSYNNGKITTMVTDNGIGMVPEMLDKIFRIDSSVTTIGTNGEEGSGFGLKLCKEMVEKNGGTIYAKSTLGEGSTFIFTTPTKKKETDI